MLIFVVVNLQYIHKLNQSTLTRGYYKSNIQLLWLHKCIRFKLNLLYTFPVQTSQRGSFRHNLP